MSNFVFMVGAPRSGTTILGEVLGKHPQTVNWYEPYFIWDYHVGNMETDCRDASHATPKVRNFILDEFNRFLRNCGASVLVEKTPTNSFRIPFMHSIFPDAKWVFLIRDGRGMTYSMHKEWLMRQAVVRDKSLSMLWGIFLEMMGYQPFWRNRFQALWFEFKTRGIKMVFNPFNKSKFGGKVGYGPRFPGWQKAFNEHSLLQFNALQWVKCNEAVLESKHLIAPENWLEIRYEDLVLDSENQIMRLLNFIGLERPEEKFWSELNTGSLDKWKNGFTPEQVAEIDMVLRPMMYRLGYYQEKN